MYRNIYRKKEKKKKERKNKKHMWYGNNECRDSSLWGYCTIKINIQNSRTMVQEIERERKVNMRVK